MAAAVIQQDSLKEKLLKKKVFTLTKRKKLDMDQRQMILDNHYMINGHDESVFENYMKHDGNDILLLNELLGKEPFPKVEDALMLCLRYAKSPAKEQKIKWWLQKLTNLSSSLPERTLIRDKSPISYIKYDRKAFIYWLFIEKGRSGTSGVLQPFTDLEFLCLKTLVELGLISGDVSDMWFQPYCHVTTFEQCDWMMKNMNFCKIGDGSGGLEWNCILNHMDKRISEQAFLQACKSDAFDTLNIGNIPFTSLLFCQDIDFVKDMLIKGHVSKETMETAVSNVNHLYSRRNVTNEVQQLLKDHLDIDITHLQKGGIEGFTPYCIHRKPLE